MYGLLTLTLLLFILLIFSIDRIDRNHYRESGFYQEMLSKINSLEKVSLTEGRLHAGWSKQHILPEKPMRIAGYGIRKEFEHVHDTVWARAVVLNNGKSKSAIISLELLIFPPIVAKLVRKELLKEGYSVDNLYFSATHTHNSIGGWADGLAGWIITGKYDPSYVAHLVNQITTAVKGAELALEPASLAFQRYFAPELVTNRLVGDKGTTDPYIRLINIQTSSNKVAVITTFSAHAICLSPNEHSVSGDYPGRLVSILEQQGKIDFAIFCAGAVGSHAPALLYKENFAYADSMASAMFNHIATESTPFAYTDSVVLHSCNVPLLLREPQFKVHQNYRLKPWIFNWLFKPEGASIQILRIGNNVLVGTPCDFSGELVKPIEEHYKKKGLNLIITSFNGDYIGYITKDEYYDLNKSETFEMNWFGPHNGEYLSEVIMKLADKL